MPMAKSIYSSSVPSLPSAFAKNSPNKNDTTSAVTNKILHTVLNLMKVSLTTPAEATKEMLLKYFASHFWRGLLRKRCFITMW
jgi:hypothetical protein